MASKRRNLVVLRYAFNECYTQVVTLTDSEVKKEKIVINERGGTWSKPGSLDAPFKIGKSCFPRQSSYEIIGIYDRTQLKHLDSMVHDSNEAIGDLRCDD